MATTYTLTYQSKPPTGLKYLKPNVTDVKLNFSVNSNDLNPFYLQELSEEVLKGYLKPLNDAWNDLWVKWDRELENKIPNFAGKTKAAREKLLTVYVGPLEMEFEKQTQNITSMAQTIGERYWQKMAKARADIRNFKLKVAAKVVWKGLNIASSLATIIASGGVAAASYISAIKNVYGIYKEMKKVFASAEDYMVKVYGDIEAIKTALFKRGGIDPENHKALLKVNDEISGKMIKTLKKNRSILDVKIKELHGKAGDVSKQLNDALDNVKEALAADKAMRKKHEQKIQDLIKDIIDMGTECKKFQQFDKTAQRYQEDVEARITDETGQITKALKAGGEGLLKVVKKILATSSDIGAAKAASSEGLSMTSMIKGWGEKIDTGLKVLAVLGIG